MIKYDYSLLRGRIREQFKSESNFAKVLRKSDIAMSTGTFSSKINGNTYFKQPEMEMICKLLKIDLVELAKYFFTPKYELNSYKN